MAPEGPVAPAKPERRSTFNRLMAGHPRSFMDTLSRSYRLAHERLLTTAGALSSEQFTWSAGPSVHSVAWHLWHAARWDDVFASYLHKALGKDPRTQVWEREALADRWSLASGALGRRDTGTEMSDEVAVLTYLEHLSRHLGMIETIGGLQRSVGSSTR